MVTTNKQSVKVNETIDAKSAAQMSPVMKTLLEFCEGQSPTYIRHNICITGDYFKEKFECEYLSQSSDLDDDTDSYTLAHYERTIENGVLKESLSHDHMFSVSDVEVYEETKVAFLFPSDSEMFGIDLISMWGKWKECATFLKRKAQPR